MRIFVCLIEHDVAVSRNMIQFRIKFKMWILDYSVLFNPSADFVTPKK